MRREKFTKRDIQEKTVEELSDIFITKIQQASGLLGLLGMGVLAKAIGKHGKDSPEVKAAIQRIGDPIQYLYNLGESVGVTIEDTLKKIDPAFEFIQSSPKITKRIVAKVEEASESVTGPLKKRKDLGKENKINHFRKNPSRTYFNIREYA